jgi:hypothetical protein
MMEDVVEHDNVKGVIPKFQFRAVHDLIRGSRICAACNPNHLIGDIDAYTRAAVILVQAGEKRTGTATNLEHTLSGQVLANKALIPGAYLLAQSRDLVVDGEHFVQGLLRGGDCLELPGIKPRIAMNNSV